MKRKNIFWIFCFTGILLFSRSLPGAEPRKAVPPPVAQAFREAGIPVLRERRASADFSLPRSGGGNLSLKSFEGKVVFLNFWATWCGPCRAEMPSMESLYQRFKDRGFEILAVNYQESEADVSGFMAQYGLSFPSGLDSSGRAAAGPYGITAFPTTYIIDREGMIIARVVGSINWNTPKIVAAFETLLAAAP